jgi:Tetratricopeptide repeat
LASLARLSRFYRQALRLKPDLVAAWSNIGKLYFALSRFAEALEAFDAALTLAPADADGWNSRAGALRKLGRLEDSAASASGALALRPDFSEAALNLGSALLKLDRMESALTAYRRARSIDPNFAAAICGEALALRALGFFSEALEAFVAAERMGCREAISGKGCLYLTLGDFERGWQGYEARWISGKSLEDALGRRFPTWTGPGKAGERVLVLNDHGLGDTIQFFRYLPLMREAGVEASFACPRGARRLLSSREDVRLVDQACPGDAYDAQIALSSLPYAFGTRLESVPAGIPYLHAEPPLAQKWATCIGADGFKIGIAWQGNLHPEADVARSMPLAEFAPLAAIADVRLISLQKGVGAHQLDDMPHGMKVESLGEDFDCGGDAFIDTAAAMMHLDLIITCDTSIAHLAGALGRPVWVALKCDAEWRWLINRADSPWYPSMRLFRQLRRGVWRDCFNEMANELRSRVRTQPASGVIAIPGAVGELIDKITILHIKARRVGDPNKLGNIRCELAMLEDCARAIVLDSPALEALQAELAAVNESLWAIEDEIRGCERTGEFGEPFIALARAVYKTNDRRAALKFEINILCRSAIVEEKSYG